MNRAYHLLCLESGREFDDTDVLLENPGACRPALLRAVYDERRFVVDAAAEGLYRYRSWLPICRTLEGSSAPVTYRSTGLAAALGLESLYITFSGYWPDRGVTMSTGTFKECEAYSVFARMDRDFDDTLVVASAGNTARAFIDVCSRNRIPLVVVVPESALPNLWIDHEIDPCVKVIAAGGESDYFDAINAANLICRIDGFRGEGGARNVARRDGMGTTVLSAVEHIGRIPDYYFQAVGSGTGAIAAWEANQRLIGDGRFGDHFMRLLVSQNSPFLVLYDSWRAAGRSLREIDPETARESTARCYAKVLSNRHPPYGVVGGLYDALLETGGEVFAVENAEAIAAAALFEETEGIDVSPAAAVAVASLVQATEAGAVDRDAVIMLNVTGGGYRVAERELTLTRITPDAIIAPREINPDGVQSAVEALFLHV